MLTMEITVQFTRWMGFSSSFDGVICHFWQCSTICASVKSPRYSGNLVFAILEKLPFQIRNLIRGEFCSHRSKCAQNAEIYYSKSLRNSEVVHTLWNKEVESAGTVSTELCPEFLLVSCFPKVFGCIGVDSLRLKKLSCDNPGGNRSII